MLLSNVIGNNSYVDRFEEPIDTLGRVSDEFVPRLMLRRYSRRMTSVPISHHPTGPECSQQSSPLGPGFDTSS